MKQRFCLMLCAGLLYLSSAVGGTEDAKPVDATRLDVKSKKKVDVSKMTAKEKKAYETAIKKAAIKKVAREKARKARRHAASDVRKLRKLRAANLEKQWKPKFQQLLNVELSFMQRVCPLTTDQHKQIADAAEDCLKDSLKKYTMAQARRGQRGVIFGGVVGVAPETASDPRPLIQRGIFKIVKEKLGPEQAKRYQAEIDKRVASKINASVRMLVAILDEKLFLSAQQRDQLSQSLKSNWQETWGRSLGSLGGDSQYFPTVDDEYVVPFLDGKQKIVWRGIEKVTFSHDQGVLENMAVVVDDFKLGVQADAAIGDDDGKPARQKK